MEGLARVCGRERERARPRPLARRGRDPQRARRRVVDETLTPRTRRRSDSPLDSHQEEFPSNGLQISYQQDEAITGNFDVFVNDALVHSKKQRGHGRCDTPAEVERVVVAVEDAIRDAAKTGAAPAASASASASTGSGSVSSSS